MDDQGQGNIGDMKAKLKCGMWNRIGRTETRELIKYEKGTLKEN